MPDADASPRTRVPLLLPLLAAAVAIGAFLVWPDGSAPAPTAAPPGASDGGADARATTEPAQVPPTANDDPFRRPAPDLVRTRPPVSANHPQGLRGRVVDATGAAVADVAVHLVESPANEPLLLPMMTRQPHFFAPVASDRTDRNGAFAVGLAVTQDKLYELYVVSARHATVHLTGLSLVAGSWHDLGEIRLDAGATLRGRVTVAGRPGLPVPHAVVTVAAGSAFADAALRALPDNEDTLVAKANPDGSYRIEHAPARGAVRVTAFAPGFVRMTRTDVELDATAPAVVDFELPAARSLTGSVQTVTGTPIAGARIEALPPVAAADAVVAISDERGAFRLEGMLAARHTVRATCNGYAPVEQREATPGEPMLLTMEPMGRLHVTVRAPTGRILRTYRLAVRRFFAADPAAPLDESALVAGNIGAVPGVPDQRVRLDGATDHAEVAGIPAGVFVCEVEADGFAKTLSRPFRYPPEGAAAGSVVRLAVTADEGFTLHGRVVDADGNPLRDAVVTTQVDGSWPDSPLIRTFLNAVPVKISRRTARTDGQGRFTLARLARASYQVQVEHPDGCRALIRHIDGNRGGERTLPPIPLARGSLVQGQVTVGGKVSGQVKVLLTTPPKTPAEQSLRLKTVTNGEGRYRFVRRIPPGSYVLRATPVGGSPADAEVFTQIVNLRDSKTEFTVPAGRDVVTIDLDVPAAN
ncbi:MAG TPA: carboxypeptidase regulatory-like domain-containing protein [bacterium]|nr:carboxypeptidase regulatory-like domain-containing protein [bacterium]